MKTNVLALLAGVGIVAAAGTASAQEAAVVEGPGYPVGEGTVIHPIVGAEVGFTDNVFYQDETDTRRMAGLLRLVAEFAVASKEIEPDEVDPLLIDGDDDVPAEPAHQKLIFRAGGGLRYDEYLSPEDFIRAQRTLGVDLKGHLQVAPQGTVSFIADERFIRDTRPTNFESFDQNNRIANTLSLGLRYQPGGRTMSGTLRWENQIDFFEDPDVRFANRMINTIHGRYEWKLFPYTLLYADVSYGFISGVASDTGLAGEQLKSGAQPIRGGVGIATVLAEVLTAKAHAGWAYASYDMGASYNAPMFGVEVGYRYSPMGRFVGEFAYEHYDSINADFFRDYRVTGRVDHTFGRVLGSAFADVRLRGYRGIPMSFGGGTERDDLIFAIGAKASFVLKDTFAIVADYRTEIDQTDYVVTLGTTPDDPSYVRTEITVGVRAAF